MLLSNKTNHTNNIFITPFILHFQFTAEIVRGLAAGVRARQHLTQAVIGHGGGMALWIG